MKTFDELAYTYGVGYTEICAYDKDKNKNELLAWCNRMIRNNNCAYFYEQYILDYDYIYYVASDHPIRSRDLDRLFKAEVNKHLDNPHTKYFLNESNTQST